MATILTYRDQPGHIGTHSPAEANRDSGAHLLDVLQEHPATRFTWLVRTSLVPTIETVVIDAAHRLAEISLGKTDPTDSAEAVRCGLRLAPTGPLLWRDLLEAEYQRGGAGALEAAVADAGGDGPRRRSRGRRDRCAHRIPHGYRHGNRSLTRIHEKGTLWRSGTRWMGRC